MTEDRILDFVNSLNGNFINDLNSELKIKAQAQVLAEVLRLLVQIRDNTEKTNKALEDIFYRMGYL